MKKFSIITFGCRLNQYQSEKIRERLSACNLFYTKNPEEADLIIVNGCVVTHRGERDTRKTIHKYKKRNKEVIATGCYIKLPYAQPEENVDFKEFKEFKTEFVPEGRPVFKQSRHRTLIGIQEGCNFKCSYCIVPFVRGNSRDRNPEDILEEIEQYAKNGTREIVLTGTEIGSYGKNSKTSLSDLIKRIKDRFPDINLRLSSILPPHVDKSLVGLFQDGTLLPHTHLPLQSGSPKVLRDMKRPYTLKKFIDSFWEIYNAHKNMSIGTDIIVGFPTESEEDFELTYQLVKDLPFAYAHVFLYSKRPLTEAARLNELPYSIIKRRERTLLELVKTKKIEFIKKFCGKTLNALVEYSINGTVKGTTENYIKFRALDSSVSEGQTVKILIEKEVNLNAYGKILL